MMRKKINLETLSIRNDYMIDDFLKGGIDMEFIDMGRGKFLLRNSNGMIVNEKEKLELEKKGLAIKDIKSDTCQEETTKKIKKINKKLNKIEKEKATKEVADDTIEETNTTI